MGSARILANGDNDLLSKIAFLKARGLYLLQEYDKALSAIDKAMKSNQGADVIRLQKYRGLIWGYQGRFAEAINLFSDLLEETNDYILLTELYSNITWANLALYRTEEKNKLLEEAKKYLDLLDDNRKKRILLNYGEYHFCNKDYNQAIEIIERAIPYCTEEEMPLVYNNLAELHFQFGDRFKTEEYLHKAEVLAEKYSNYLEVAKSLYTQGLLEIKDDEWLKATDSLYVSLKYFIKTNAISYAFNCFIQILDISHQLENDCVLSIKRSAKDFFSETPFYNKM